MTLVRFVSLAILFPSLVMSQHLSHPLGADHRLHPPPPATSGATGASGASGDTLRVLAAMVQFVADTDTKTTGTGRFLLTARPDSVIDAPPHDRAYFEQHMTFLAELLPQSLARETAHRRHRRRFGLHAVREDGGLQPAARRVRLGPGESRAGHLETRGGLRKGRRFLQVPVLRGVPCGGGAGRGSRQPVSGRPDAARYPLHHSRPRRLQEGLWPGLPGHPRAGGSVPYHEHLHPSRNGIARTPDGHRFRLSRTRDQWPAVRLDRELPRAARPLRHADGELGDRQVRPHGRAGDLQFLRRLPSRTFGLGEDGARLGDADRRAPRDLGAADPRPHDARHRVPCPVQPDRVLPCGEQEPRPAAERTVRHVGPERRRAHAVLPAGHNGIQCVRHLGALGGRHGCGGPGLEPAGRHRGER